MSPPPGYTKPIAGSRNGESEKQSRIRDRLTINSFREEIKVIVREIKAREGLNFNKECIDTINVTE